jgi:sugar/nucleoside kinase (ribokinase family)
MTTLVVGDIVTDILALHESPLAADSDTAARIRMTGGGSAANTAAWLASALSPVALVGVVGEDEAGAARLAELTAAGVACECVRRAAEAATGSVVVLSDGVDRTMLTDRAANGLLEPADIDAALAAVESPGHLHLSGYVLFDEASAPAGEHALNAARGRAITTSVDAASAAPLAALGAERFFGLVRRTDVLFANEDEARVLTGLSASADKLAVALLPYATTVVVKCGPEGAMWAGADGSVLASPASPASTVVDQTGAGDAFAAGYLAAWRAGGSPAEALAAGARLGALAVTRFGARP